MPNHITNIIKLEGDRLHIQKLLETIYLEEYGLGTVDFNKVIREMLRIMKPCLSKDRYKMLAEQSKLITMSVGSAAVSSDTQSR